MTVKIGTVCTGIGGAEVASHGFGWESVWFSEIEPSPCSVLSGHWPDVPNLGDMTALPEMILNRTVPVPDIFAGGTPCQAFSVAGNRDSLSDDRGNLSLTFCEIADAIDTIRQSDGDEPAVIWWENVPGVLSTKDNAFGCFLAGLAGDSQPIEPGPRPEQKRSSAHWTWKKDTGVHVPKWTKSGVIVGPRRTVAWRTLDAQYFGLAQRRKRVFVVASARDGFDPAEVLFESESLRRDTPPSREKEQEIAGTIDACASRSRGAGTNPGMTVPCWWDGGQVSQTLDAVLHKGQTMPGKNRFPAVLDHAYSTSGAGCWREGLGPLRAREQDSHENLVCIHGTQDPIVNQDKAHALGRNSGQENVLRYPIADQATRHAGKRGKNQDGKGNGLGIGAPFDPSFTLTKGDKHAVAAPYAFQPRIGKNGRGDMGDLVHALSAQAGETGKGDAAPCVAESMRVRRLTPKECERLQGFPDGHTDVLHKGKPAADGPRYKSLGNAWAVYCARWLAGRINEQINH